MAFIGSGSSGLYVQICHRDLTSARWLGSLQATLRLLDQWPGRCGARRADAAQACRRARPHHLHILRQILTMQKLQHESIEKVALNGIVEGLAKQGRPNAVSFSAA